MKHKILICSQAAKLLVVVLLFSSLNLFANIKFSGKSQLLVLTLPGQEAIISSRLESIVTDIFVNEGERVSEGEKCVALDIDPLIKERTVLQKKLSALKVRSEYLKSYMTVQKSL